MTRDTTAPVIVISGSAPDDETALREYPIVSTDETGPQLLAEDPAAMLEDPQERAS
jgi:hypothetical protein